jgi:hypothetical protein
MLRAFRPRVVPRVLSVALSALLLAELLRPTPAVAQAQQGAAQEDPRELEARTACAAGDVDKGIAILARMFAETSDYTWVYNQGRCYQQNGRTEQALNRFREYLRRGQNLSAEEKSEVEGFIRELEAEQQKKGGAATTAVPAPTGQAPGASGGTMTATPTAAPPRGGGWPWQKKVGVGALAVSGAALVVGVVFHLGREGKAGSFGDANCFTSDLSRPGCRDLYDQVQFKQKVAIAGYVGAAVLGATGGLLLWLGGRSGSGESASGGSRLACAPQLGGAGVSCGGRF